MATTIKKSKDLTLHDRLSRLTFVQAIQMLRGDEAGKKLLYAGGRMTVEDIDEQVMLQGDLFRLSLPNEGVRLWKSSRSPRFRRKKSWRWPLWITNRTSARLTCRAAWTN